MLRKTVLALLLLSVFPSSGQLPEGIPSGSIQGFWSFSGNADDVSGNLRHSQAYDVALVKDRFGNENAAYHFNGNSSYLNTRYPGILGNGARTVSFWAVAYDSIHPMSAVSWGKAASSPARGSHFNCAFNYKAKGVTIDLSGAFITFEANEPFYDGKWHHYVFLFNKELLKDVEIYQDGNFLTHEPARFLKTTPVNTRLGSPLTFGAVFDRDTALFFKGELDDIAVYDRALSQSEIIALYNAPNPQQKVNYLKWLAYLSALAGLLLVIRITIRLRVKALLKKEKEKFLDEKKWYEQENRVLKAQMDPHFIFNSLNSIQQFIIVNENDKAKRYLSTFSQLIRMQLERNTSENLQLTQELDIIEKYLQIESLRFNNVFDYKISFKDLQDMQAIQIPSFLIQPFVENALHHGLLPKIGDKKLSILFEKEDEQTLICTVDDNGVGRKNPRTRQTAYKKKSLGINFVQQRLANMSKLQARQYGVEILDKEDESGNSEGTSITIKIPIVKP
jgi:hypothetical protein